MEMIIRFSAVCVLGALLAVFIGKSSPDMGLMVTLAACAILLASLTIPLRQVMDLVREIIGWSGLQEEVFMPLLKTLGIGLVCRIGGELCRDAGQSAMASLVEIGGAVCTILVSVPLLYAVWEMLQSLI